MAAGCERIDFDAMKKHGVRFGYTFGVNKLSVAELTLSFMIAGLRMVGEQNLAMRNGERPGMRSGGLLTGRTVGLHGCGNIGKEVVRLLKPFGCTVLACDVKDYAGVLRGERRHAGRHGRAAGALRGAVAAPAQDQGDARALFARRCSAESGPGPCWSTPAAARSSTRTRWLERTGGRPTAEPPASMYSRSSRRCATACCAHPRMLATPHIGAGADEIRIAMVDAAIRGPRGQRAGRPGKVLRQLRRWNAASAPVEQADGGEDRAGDGELGNDETGDQHGAPPWVR